jgi:hypothetical protein
LPSVGTGYIALECPGVARDESPHVMTSVVVRFPPRRMAAVFICEERSGDAWLVIAGSHAWLHGDRRSALADAYWLSSNLGLPVRETP